MLTDRHPLQKNLYDPQGTTQTVPRRVFIPAALCPPKKDPRDPKASPSMAPEWSPKGPLGLHLLPLGPKMEPNKHKISNHCQLPPLISDHVKMADLAIGAQHGCILIHFVVIEIDGSCRLSNPTTWLTLLPLHEF